MPQEFTIQPSPSKRGSQLNAGIPGYDEGQWTPSVGGTATYGSATEGIYTRIGRIVHITGRIQIVTIGTGSFTIISGLPFTSMSILGGFPLAVSFSGGIATAVTELTAIVPANTTTIQMRSRTAAATEDAANAIFKAAADVIFNGSYSIA